MYISPAVTSKYDTCQSFFQALHNGNWLKVMSLQLLQLGVNTMAEVTEQSAPAFRLLDLPDATVDTTVRSLAEEDKINFMAANRKAAHVTLMTANESTLRITQDIKFAGIRQVLDASTAPIHLEIICTSDEESQPFSLDTPSAVDMFMEVDPRYGLAVGCRWENITKATIKGTNLRCLVPPFLASSCPNLTQLKIVTPDFEMRELVTSKEEFRLPLNPCNSLKHLHLDSVLSDTEDGPSHGAAIQGQPTAYHTVAEMRDNLPHIDTLIMRTPIHCLLEAFASQLTCLEIGHHIHLDINVPGFITDCSCLQPLGVDAAALKAVKLGYDCSNDDMRLLMKLPNLETLWLQGLKYLSDQDWSNHACSWQDLHIDNIGQFKVLANLSLSGLKKLTTCSDLHVILPDPSDPNSLAAVKRAADNLSLVGKIMLDGNAHSEGCETIRWWFRPEHGFSMFCEEPDIDQEEQAAELIATAAQRIGAVKTCNCENLVKHPLVLRAVLEWGHTFIETVCLGKHYEPPPHVWQALQQLHRLSTVVFWYTVYSKEDLAERQAYEQRQIPILVCDAAQHYVITTNKNLRMEFCLGDADGDNDSVDDNDDDKQQDIDADTYSRYCAVIQDKLPAGSKLVSAELYPAANSRGTYIYGGACNPKAIWVVVVGPS